MDFHNSEQHFCNLKLTGKFATPQGILITLLPPLYQNRRFSLLLILAAISVIAYIVLRHIRNIKEEADLKQKIAETEMMALRSQMNPHFIFNSLNGIEYFILQNEKRNAIQYLNKFASLIRIILSNSRKNVVLFAEDMQTIRLYLDLELLRFNHNFCYISDIDQPLLEADYRVPPFLIQPFVENAIIHGFANSERKDLQLKISAKLEQDYIRYIIEDNGVGREESSIYNSLNKPKHESLGLQITQQRLNIFNERHKSKGFIKIEDLFDGSRHACGTRVTVKIKTN